VRSDHATQSAPVLELREVTVVRGDRPVLDRISLKVSEGEHTAILGPNGSGKSTLIQLLTCQIYPLARRGGDPPIRIFGRDRWSVADLRSRLGIVSTDLHHRFVSGSSLGRVTGEEAVTASFFSSEVLFIHHAVTGEMRARSAAALERLEASHLAGVRMHRMSTGEVKRVLIARALVHEPRVLVLDEPTTGLDLVARGEFLEMIGRLALGGTTILLVTHHLEEIIPEIGRVILLRDGRVAADGAVGDVLTSEAVSRAYGAPLQLHGPIGGYRATVLRGRDPTPSPDRVPSPLP